jgi:hypothetical protein
MKCCLTIKTNWLEWYLTLGYTGMPIDKHSSLLGPFVSNEENEVLLARLLSVFQMLLPATAGNMYFILTWVRESLLQGKAFCS